MSVLNVQDMIASGTVMNTNLASSAICLQTTYTFSITVVFTGTPTGSFKLQASNDPHPIGNRQGPDVPVNWGDIVNSAQAVSAAGEVTWNYSMAGFNFLRVVYTDGSNGNSTAIITVCQINGK